MGNLCVQSAQKEEGDVSIVNEALANERGNKPKEEEKKETVELPKKNPEDEFKEMLDTLPLSDAVKVSRPTS